MKNLRVRLTFLILLSAGISVGVVLSRALETHAVGVTQSPLTQRTNFSHVPASPPFSNIEVLERARRGEIPAYAGGDNGVAFILFVDAAGTRSLSHVRTSMPVHKVFGLLT